MAQDEIGQGRDVGESKLGPKLKEPFRHFPSVTAENLEETCITRVGRCFRVFRVRSQNWLNVHVPLSTLQKSRTSNHPHQ